MHKHPDITKVRLRQFVDRQLKPLLYPKTSTAFQLECWRVGGEPVDYATAVSQQFEPVEVGAKWGGNWDTTWFRFSGVIPVEWAGADVRLLVDLGGVGSAEGFTAEGLVWKNDAPAGAINLHRADVKLTVEAEGGEAFEIYIEAGANGYAAKCQGIIQETEAPDYTLPSVYELKQATLAVFDADIWRLLCDFELLREGLEQLDPQTPKHGQWLRGLNEVVNRFDPRDRKTWPECQAILERFYGQQNGSTVHRISAIGHAHIDTAWLWPLRESIRKCARTVSTALAYMEEYPDYVFGCSQPVQYSWMKKYYPAIYEGIKEAHKRGQWELLGAMWVEPDCNLTSGESLVRQILLGKQFFEDEFGTSPDNVWIPDVFGYAASMPQIMKKSGLPYFLTQKISWSQFNRFPHHSFQWQGIDGSRVFAHFPPSDTYNADFSAGQLMGSQKKFRDHDRSTRSLYCYGYGDGGGGPTRRMLERAKRLKNCEGFPAVTLEKASEFFPKAAAEVNDPSLWVGELYLEYHRGTYTTQAKIKKANRRGEIALRNAEWLDAMAHLQVPVNEAEAEERIARAPARAVWDTFEYSHPAKRGGCAALLDRGWKLLLLNQFHDILPGSSIRWVYDNAEQDYATIDRLTREVEASALARLEGLIDTRAFEAPVLLLNPSGFARREVFASLKGGHHWVEVPPCGYRVIEGSNAAGPVDQPEMADSVQVTEETFGIRLENGLLRVQVDAEGHLAEVYDKVHGRQVLARGQPGNAFHLHRDEPMAYDAWDVDIYDQKTGEVIQGCESCEIGERHPLRSSVRLVKRFGESRIKQSIILHARSRRIDFETVVDWREHKRLLKAVFPVAVHSERATYEIQYGSIERKTHANTSWEMAQFEVPAQRWADLSEGNYGVALLNDSKYGYAIEGSLMRLSLLRASTYPDAEADRGVHHFTYALLPHEGDHRSGGVIEEAEKLNRPLLAHSLPRQEGRLPAGLSWLSFEREGLYLTAVKIAEREDALIVRLYEGWGARGEASLFTELPVWEVYACDLLEQAYGEPLPLDGQRLRFEVKPFEILTLKLMVELPI